MADQADKVDCHIVCFDDHFESDSGDTVSSIDDKQDISSSKVGGQRQTSDAVDDGEQMSDRQVLEAVKILLKGVSDNPSEHGQNGMEGQSEPLHVKAPSSKRLYNWNTTHFYPDIHKLDRDELSVLRQRRHSEPRCFLRFTDSVSSYQQSTDSTSLLTHFDEVKDTEVTMPVSQLTVQLTAPPSMTSGPIAKVDVDLDSSSESEDDGPKIWHRSPLHIRRGRRLGVERHSEKKIDSSLSPGELWKRASDRPSMRFKEQAEKRRKFLHERCQMYGWDLTTDQEKQSVSEGHREEGRQSAEDICFIDHSPEASLANQDNGEHSSASAMKDYVHQFEAAEILHASVKDIDQCNENYDNLHFSSVDMSPPKSTSVNISVKESSSFENIYDTVSLEPEKSSDDVEVMQLYEPREKRMGDFSYQTEPSPSDKLPQASTAVAAYSVNNARPSSAPSKSTQKVGLDAKSIVEEEKLKFVEYRIEYRRQHSSGNESGSGKSDGEKDTRKQVEPTSKPHQDIPPDDYEYILRKIHYNRPQNKTGQKSAASQQCSVNQGSELHIEIKKPHTTTHRVTVDVTKPSVPHRVESLQHMHHQLPARPDVIPSPNYPPSPNVIAYDFVDGADAGKDLKIRPDRHSHTDYPSMLSGPSVLPTPGERYVYQWDNGSGAPDRERFRPQYVAATSNHSQNNELGRKPPKPPREELPRNQSPDFWNYNTTYEPSSPSSQRQPVQSLLNKELEMRRASETEPKDSAMISDQNLVHDFVRSLDENAELNPKAATVFREQYRWSIHEPCHSVKPDQLKHNHVSQLPCSQVFASNVCMPSKPVQLVGQVSQPSSKDSGAVRSHKETVFSVTGYHRPQYEKTNDLTQNVYQKEVWMNPSHADVRESYNSHSVVEREPLYWYSGADKRKPIINSPEVETALKRDCRQTHFYCGNQQADGQNLPWDSSSNRRQCSEVDYFCHEGSYAEHDVHKDAKLSGQKSQDRLVQQMSVGSQEVTDHLHSYSSYSAASFPVSHPHNVHITPSNHSLTETSSAVRSCKLSPAKVGQHKDVQSVKTSDHVPSRASTDYEKHILRSQESFRSQVMARIEPSSVAASCTVQDRCSDAENCRNVTKTCSSYGASKGCTAERMAGFEVGVKNFDVTSCDRFQPETNDKTFSVACMTNNNKREIGEDEELYPVNVAAIKTKLFGPNEDGARKLFQQQNNAVKGSLVGRSGDRTFSDRISYSNGEQKKQSFVPDELTDFENLIERLNKDDVPLESRSEWFPTSPSASSVKCSSADDPNVKRLSVTNIKMLEGNRGKQSPSLEYTKEWLIGGRHASASDKLSQCIPSHHAVERKVVKSTAHNVPSAENVDSLVSHKVAKGLLSTESGDVCRPIVTEVGSRSINAVTKSDTGALRSPSTDVLVAFRSRPVDHLSFSRGSSSDSFARRSLPALTEKDAERWKNMVSRIQENEHRKEAKSRSVERLSQLHCDHERCTGSAVNMQMPVGMQANAFTNAECKLTVNTQPVIYSTPDVMIPTDPVNLKLKRQQTPRDVKYRDESRMKGTRVIHSNTDSGYLDSGSDSHGSSSADLPKRLPSQSNESDELELQRYTCDEDDIKMSSGSLSVSKIDSACSLADKTDACEVTLSEYKVSSESRESRAKQLQKLRQDWLSKNVHQSHSSSLSDKSDTLNTAELYCMNKNVGSEYSEFGRSVPSSFGLPKGNLAKPLYVSPLVQTSSCGIYRTPLSGPTRSGDDSNCAAVDSTHLSGPSKISSFKMIFPSQGSGQNTSTGVETTITSEPSRVTHIPVKAAGFHAEQSPAHSSAFTPYVQQRDLQISKTDSGGASVTEMKKELIQIEPAQYKASRAFERTVEQPSLKTYQSASIQFKHERQDVNEPNVKITRQITDGKVERTYRIERDMQPKSLQLSTRNEWDKCETSDGEMTDATDITLDVMVGTNQSLITPTADVVDFSDVEFLSSANLPSKYDNSFMNGSTKPYVSHPVTKTLADTASLQAEYGSRNVALVATKAETELYKKNKKTEVEAAPVERRRSIKELVHSFEGMTTPFMRARPRSMEIRINSSSSEDNQDDDVTGRERKNVTLRASSSFKEASRFDKKNYQLHH